MSTEVEVIKVLVSEDPMRHVELFGELAYTYMVIFGNTEPLCEGAVDSVGKMLPLGRYLDLLSQSCLVGVGMSERGVVRTEDQISWLKWLDSLSVGEREMLFLEVKERTGFLPYYRFENVLKRFFTDMTPFEDAVPVVTYWDDDEYSVCGFLSGVVVKNSTALSRLVDNIPYLTAVYGDVNGKLRSLLARNNIDMPLLLESEGGVISSRAGKRNGSRWDFLLLGLRKQGLVHGSSHSLGFTFAASRYYVNGSKNKEFVDQVILSDGRGNELVLVLVDLKLSVAILQDKVSACKLT